MRVQISVPDALLKDIDEFAKSHYITRSAVMIQATTNYLASNRVSLVLVELANALKRLGTKENADAETLKEIEQYYSLIQTLFPSVSLDSDKDVFKL